MTVLSQLEVFNHAVEVFRRQTDRPNYLRASRTLTNMGLHADRRTLKSWYRDGRITGKGKTPSIQALLAVAAPPTYSTGLAAEASGPTVAPARSSETSEPGAGPSPSVAPPGPSVGPQAPATAAPAARPVTAEVVPTPEARLAKLRHDAIDTVVAQSRVIDSGTQLAHGVMVTGTHILAGLHPIAARLKEVLTRQAAAPGADVDVDLVLRRIALLSKILGDAGAASERLIAAHRLLMNAPNSIVEHRSGQAPVPIESPTQTAARLREIMTAFEDADRELDSQGRPLALSPAEDEPPEEGQGE